LHYYVNWVLLQKLIIDLSITKNRLVSILTKCPLWPPYCFQDGNRLF